MRTLITFLLLFGGIAGATDYKAREQENAIQLKTPYGEKTLLGDYGLGSYRIEIPIEELEPESLKRRRLAAEGENGLNSITNSTNSSNSNNTVESKETRIIETRYAESENANPLNKTPRVIVEYDDSDRLVLEANRLYNQRKYHEAIATVDELLRRKPTLVRGWVMKGSLMYVKGHKDLAKSAWNQALSLDPKNPDIKSIIEKYK